MNAPANWDVLFLLLPDSLILDWAGPAEALRIANQAVLQQGKPAPFQLRFVSPQPETVSSVGVTIAGLEPLPSHFERPSWIVLLGQPGQCIAVDDPATQSALRWLRPLRLINGELELLTVCAGAVLAAHAGLLNGRRATTHHQHLEELQSVAPACQVVSNRVFVEDAPVYSSAGVTTGVDLVLHRISQVCGAAVAAQVAQTMVVAMRRGPQDPELSPFLAYRNHLHPALHRVQDAISHAPASDWSLAAMAAIAHASPRHLTRLFVEHASVAPLAYLRQIRLAVAQQALRSGRNVTQAAEMAGFGSDTQLRRAWRQFGPEGTPSQAGGAGA
jgi:transcriptional regulator GlxA family with amidase domain